MGNQTPAYVQPAAPTTTKTTYDKSGKPKVSQVPISYSPACPVGAYKQCPITAPSYAAARALDAADGRLDGRFYGQAIAVPAPAYSSPTMANVPRASSPFASAPTYSPMNFGGYAPPAPTYSPMNFGGFAPPAPTYSPMNFGSFAPPAPTYSPMNFGGYAPAPTYSPMNFGGFAPPGLYGNVAPAPPAYSPFLPSMAANAAAQPYSPAPAMAPMGFMPMAYAQPPVNMLMPPAMSPGFSLPNMGQPLAFNTPSLLAAFGNQMAPTPNQLAMGSFPGPAPYGHPPYMPSPAGFGGFSAPMGPAAPGMPPASSCCSAAPAPQGGPGLVYAAPPAASAAFPMRALSTS